MAKTKLDLSEIERDIKTLAARAVKNPRVVLESSSHLNITGLWKKHLPYLINFDIISNPFGGVEVRGAVLSYYGLYSRRGQGVIATQLDLNGGDAGYLLTISDAMKYIVKLLGVNREFTHTPPKNLSRDELIDWTFKHAGTASRTTVEQFFDEWKI